MDTIPLFEFSDRAELRQWLEENHGTTPLCWVATTRGKESRRGAIPYLEFVAERDLLKILRLLDDMGIRYWVDGGWGVDILAGRRTRRHRDLDIDYVPFPAFPPRDRSSSTQATSCAKNMHHEIYLSDPRKTSADKFKTVIRYPVK